MEDILSALELDELLKSLAEQEVKQESQVFRTKVRVYDFKRPDKFSKDHIRTLQLLHENFARLLTTAFSASFRTMVQATVVSVQQETYQEFEASLSSPTTIGIISLAPLEGKAILELSQDIAFPMVDRLFGGPGNQLEYSRALTDIEQTVIKSVYKTILRNLAEAWKNVVSFQPKLDGMETNPVFAQIIAPSEMVVHITVNIKLGEHNGDLNLCLPYILLEPVLSKLSAKQWFAREQKKQSNEEKYSLEKRVKDVALPVSVELGKATLTIEEFIQLEQDDVLQLEKKITDLLDIYVGGLSKFRGSPGRKGKRLALRIVEVTEIEDREVQDNE